MSEGNMISDMRLDLQGLSKRYGEKQVLSGFSCLFTEGITGVLGPNGAGKSTLMNLITDNIRRDEGTILYGDADILKLGSKYRAVLGYMPQEQGMYEDFSARSFLLYMAKLKGLKSKESTRQVEELLELVGLKEAAHRKLKQYSGGMRQRVLLCQALLGDPKVILLDEPTAGLDIEERIKITEYIEKLSKGRIVLWSTHIVSDIEQTASRVLILKKGRNLACETVERLCADTGTKNLSEAYLYYMEKTEEKNRG